MSSTFRYWLTWLWCRSTSSSPSSAYRRLVRNTVRSDTCRAAATWEAVQPSSILSRMRARVIAWAEPLPARIILLSRPFSWTARRTPYISCTMDAPPTTQLLSKRQHPGSDRLIPDNTALTQYQTSTAPGKHKHRSARWRLGTRRLSTRPPNVRRLPILRHRGARVLPPGLAKRHPGGPTSLPAHVPSDSWLRFEV